MYLPEEKILFMSEAYLNRIFPAMRSAYPSEWVTAIERAQEMDVDTYVPGHGFVDSPEILREELETYRLALLQVIAEAQRLHAAGLTADEAVEQAEFGDLQSWSLSASQAGHCDPPCVPGARGRATRSRSMKKLAGRVALVSSSGRGIGRAVAIKLASEGATARRRPR